MSSDLILLIAVLAMILVDVLYGTIGALITNTFSSSKMRSGLLHKSAELVVLLVAYLFEWVFANGITLTGYDTIQANIPTFAATAAYILVMEVGSVLELCVKYNPDLADSKLFRLFGGKK